MSTRRGNEREPISHERRRGAEPAREERPTPAPRSSRPSYAALSRGVPADLLDEATQRLGLLALMLAVGDVVALVVPYAARSEHFGDPRVHLTAHVSFLGGSAAVAYVALRRKVPRALVLDLALAYQLFACAAIATLVNVRPWPAVMGLPGWSPVAVLTLIAPIVVPTTSWRAWVAAAFGASTEPLAVLFHAELFDTMEVPAPGAMLFRFLPNIVVVPVAVGVARIVHRLGERLARATELGSYRLLELIGEGGMGEVWRASHRLLAREAAVKLIRSDLLADGKSGETARARFEREARVIASLRSPYTIQLYDYGVGSDGTLYYVMELLDGVDLETLVEREGPLDAERVVSIARQACRSLGEAHAAGLVHRDIKPANLFVCGDGDHVKVLDFGLVRERLAPNGESLTQNDVIVGTPAYMAPEIALGAKPDGRADLYALGCVMYYLLTGRRVFDVGGAIEAAVAHATRSPVPPRERTDRAIPPALEALVLRCLEKDPARRPAGAGELEDLLASLETS